MVNNLPASTGRAETHVRSLGGEDPLEKDMEAHLSILTWRIHAQTSLAGYCLWSHKELDMTEHKRGHTRRERLVALFYLAIGLPWWLRW